MTHHLPKPRGFNNEGWITRKSVVLFNADDVIFSMKGGLSPTKASCIRATGSCQDPWIHSPSLKTNVTANLASLLFSLSPQSKNKKEGKSHSMNDGGVFWYQRPPQQSGGNLMEMSHWMNKTKTSELTHGGAVSARVSFFFFFFPKFYSVLINIPLGRVKKTKQEKTSSSLSNPHPTILALSCPSRSVVD